MEAPDTIGVANPAALAETVIGRRVDWRRISRPEVLVAEALQTPMEMLVDPTHRSILYWGAEREEDGRLRRLTPDEALKSIEDLEIPGVRVRPDLEVRLGPINAERVRHVLHDAVVIRDVTVVDAGWCPAGVEWYDPGDFFEEAAEAGDPIQGGLADCYLIAALGAVAWVQPKTIAQRTSRLGVGQQEFVDAITFHGSSGSEEVEVTEKLAVDASTHNYRYARSAEPGEIWPAVYEKAFAKWKTGTATDQPDMLKIAFGSSVGACQALAGGTIIWKATASTSAHDLWQFVRGHSLSYKTFDPMVAWTYGSGADSPDNVDYGAAKIAANHAYTVLGWDYEGGDEYIVLRNPWGWYVPTSDVLSGQWTSYDTSYWRPETMGTNGVFGLKATAFKKYFSGIGCVE